MTIIAIISLILARLTITDTLAATAPLSATSPDCTDGRRYFGAITARAGRDDPATIPRGNICHYGDGYLLDRSPQRWRKASEMLLGMRIHRTRQDRHATCDIHQNEINIGDTG